MYIMVALWVFLFGTTVSSQKLAAPLGCGAPGIGVRRSTVAKATCTTSPFKPEDNHTLSWPMGTGGTADVTSLTSFGDLFQGINDQEGLAFGGSMASGIEHMRASRFAKHTQGFFTQSWQTKHIVHSTLQPQLTDVARDMLQNSPTAFLDEYGDGYVSRVIFGRAAHGSIVVAGRGSPNLDSIRKFAGDRVGNPLSSSITETAFMNALNESFNKVQMFMAVTCNGDTNTSFSSPSSVMRAFRACSNTLPVPLRVEIRPWSDASSVREIISTMNLTQEVAHRFSYRPERSPGFTALLSQEAGKLLGLAESIRQASAWSGVNLTDAFSDLQQRVAVQQQQLDTITDSEFDVLQQSYIRGDNLPILSSSQTYEAEYDALLEQSGVMDSTTTSTTAVGQTPSSTLPAFSGVRALTLAGVPITFFGVLAI